MGEVVNFTSGTVTALIEEQNGAADLYGQSEIDHRAGRITDDDVQTLVEAYCDTQTRLTWNAIHTPAKSFLEVRLKLELLQNLLEEGTAWADDRDDRLLGSAIKDINRLRQA